MLLGKTGGKTVFETLGRRNKADSQLFPARKSAPKKNIQPLPLTSVHVAHVLVLPDRVRGEQEGLYPRRPERADQGAEVRLVARVVKVAHGGVLVLDLREVIGRGGQTDGGGTQQTFRTNK